MAYPKIRLQLIDDQPDGERAQMISDLTQLDRSQDECQFVLPTEVVIQQALADPSRHLFAVVLDEGPGHREVRGLGVLHPDGADQETWPSGLPHVLLRGLAVDSRFRRQGSELPHSMRLFRWRETSTPLR